MTVKTQTTRETEVLENVVMILKNHLKPSKIILFGSRAKEMHNPNADFDFAVDVEYPSLRAEREMKEEIENVSGLYSVDIVYLPSLAEEFKNLILKTGKTVYER